MSDERDDHVSMTRKTSRRGPARPFFLFGMGPRTKMVYRAGVLLDVRTRSVIRRWNVVAERIEASEYRVELETRGGERVSIEEDGAGVWLNEIGRREALSEGPVRLPRFDGHPHAATLRTLHHEILINLVEAGPVPNLLVYPRPWYRDAAMMAMCLEKTDNVGLLRDWILALRQPFDRNNAGNAEPDNLGELLYLVSLVSDAGHPVVGTVLREVERFRTGRHIVGITDGREHPVYQTKWLKFGLRRLGLPDDFGIPRAADPYSSLFWMDYRAEHVDGPRFGERAAALYPYLVWAEDHFLGAEPRMAVGDTYPLSWETQASEADYAKMELLDGEFARAKTCVPHAWHAAEMFLYLIERGAKTEKKS